MADTEITWRGLTLGGDGPYIVSEITGWDDLTEVEAPFDQPRVRGHGDHIGDQRGPARIVTVIGKVADSVRRDELARALQAVTTVSSAVETLAVDMLGIPLTAGARVVRRSVATAGNYSVGELPFAVQWRCPDPLRYGPAQTVSTGLPTSGGGLAYPLAYPLDYGTLGATGQVTVTNPGTADAALLLAVSGSLPLGFEVSAAGDRLRYPVDVPAGQTVVMDTAAGTVLVEGTADRRQNLTVADWLTVPSGQSLTLQLTSLGGAYDAAAQLSVTYAAAYW